jgi:hypothetical protein
MAMSQDAVVSDVSVAPVRSAINVEAAVESVTTVTEPSVVDCMPLPELVTVEVLPAELLPIEVTPPELLPIGAFATTQGLPIGAFATTERLPIVVFAATEGLPIGLSAAVKLLASGPTVLNAHPELPSITA